MSVAPGPSGRITSCDGVVLARSTSGFLPAHKATGYSHNKNCGSFCVLIAGEQGLSLSTEYKSSWGPAVLQWPRKGGGQFERFFGAGGVNGLFSSAARSSANCITSCHKGATIKPATLFSMGVLSLFPAHTPMAIDGV